MNYENNNNQWCTGMYTNARARGQVLERVRGYSMNKLFVYGIFLEERNRQHYGMTNPRYDVVRDYITWGDFIVEAIPVDSKHEAALTGLVVDVEPDRWPEIDRLEGGYDRREIITITGVQAYMYVRREREQAK